MSAALHLSYQKEICSKFIFKQSYPRLHKTWKTFRYNSIPHKYSMNLANRIGAREYHFNIVNPSSANTLNTLKLIRRQFETFNVRLVNFKQIILNPWEHKSRKLNIRIFSLIAHSKFPNPTLKIIRILANFRHCWDEKC